MEKTAFKINFKLFKQHCRKKFENIKINCFVRERRYISMPHIDTSSLNTAMTSPRN